MASVRPMLAVLAEAAEVPLTSERLVYEPKYDGIRALVAIEPQSTRSARSGRAASVTIRSRNGHDKTLQFPDLVEAFEKMAAKLPGPLLVDGEVVAIDERGRPASFTRLQKRIHLTGAKAIAGLARAQPVVFKAFDLLRTRGADLRRLPFTERRIRLQREFRPPARSPLGLSEIAVGDGRALLRRAKKEGWEGLVVKDAASIYESGRRSPAWRKLKLLKRQAFIVGGWTEPRQSRAHFGALLLGVRDESGLRFVGSVGSGFDEDALGRIATLLDPLTVKSSPFSEPFRTLERAHWVEPTLVVEVKYTELTPDGRLRHPVFLGLRTDKDAGEVRDTSGDADGTRPALSGVEGHSILGARKDQNPQRATRNPQRASKPATRNPKLETLVETLHEMEEARRDGLVDLPNGDRLRVTNLWKVFWPELKITKGELLRYYAEVSPFLLPAVADRPLVMKRFPNGIHGITFYQQRVLEKPPQGVRTEALPAGLDPIKEDEEATNPARFIGGSLTTLLYMAQVAAISQDPWFSTVSTPLEPDQVAIDLDPGKGTTFATVLDVARWVRDELERLHIPSVPKTSGSRGLHIYVPLPPGTTYETGLLLCQVVATLVSTRHRRQATIERMVAKRPRGTVYVDYLQNILGKTLATAYSVRASAYAGVSTPLTWNEVDEGVDPGAFTIRTAPARFREVGDLWARLRTGKRVDIEDVLRKGT
jgi:bifunctional non-homologous end joining protein LigD